MKGDVCCEVVKLCPVRVGAKNGENLWENAQPQNFL